MDSGDFPNWQKISNSPQAPEDKIFWRASVSSKIRKDIRNVLQSLYAGACA
jgi:hypothetical protein